MFKFNFLSYGPVNWKGYITILGNRFTNKFLKENSVKSLTKTGFTLRKKNNSKTKKYKTSNG